MYENRKNILKTKLKEQLKCVKQSIGQRGVLPLKMQLLQFHKITVLMSSVALSELIIRVTYTKAILLNELSKL